MESESDPIRDILDPQQDYGLSMAQGRQVKSGSKAFRALAHKILRTTLAKSTSRSQASEAKAARARLTRGGIWAHKTL
jgi:hypothetical protein